jgi:hypothetical protein
MPLPAMEYQSQVFVISVHIILPFDFIGTVTVLGVQVMLLSIFPYEYLLPPMIVVTQSLFSVSSG